MKARIRRAPAVEKAPIGRAAARRTAVVSARRHQFANCHRAHQAAAV